MPTANEYQPCKLTDAGRRTRGGCVFNPGDVVRVDGPPEMCVNGIHFYRHPLLAAFFCPIHVEWRYLHVGTPGGEIIHDGEAKSVCAEWTAGEAVALPEITTEQRVEIAIRCAMLVCDDEDWRAWADSWLCGSDRAAAEAAAWAAEAAAAAGDALSIIIEVVGHED